MNCQQATRHIWDYCNNQLSSNLTADLDVHCAECASCRQHLELTLLENEVLHQAGDIPPLSPDFTARVMKKLSDGNNSAYKNQINPSRRHQIFSYLRVGSSTAVLGILLMLVILPGLLNKQNIPDVKAPLPQTSLSGKSDIGEFKNNILPVQSSEKKPSTPEVGSVHNQADSNPPDVHNSVLPENDRTGKVNPAASPVSRSYQSSETVLPPVTENISGYPYPVSFPSDYQLVEINSTGNNSVNYHFTQSGSDVGIDLTVSRSESDLTGNQVLHIMKSESSLDSTSPAPKNNALGAAQKYGGYVDQSDSEVSWFIKENAQTFRATLSGNLSPQDLAGLVSAIKLQIQN